MSSSANANAAPAQAPRAGRPAAWGALGVLGLAGWLASRALGPASPAWQALLVNFIFFTPLAAALVVWPAAVMLSRGRWLAPAQRDDALAGVAFAPASLIAFAALWFGRAHWAPWLHDAALPHRAWLSAPFLFARDGAALVLWWLAAAVFARKARQGTPKVLAGWVAVVYAVVFTLVAFDLVMGLAPRWCSTLFGAYFFISGMYAAIALLAFLAARQPGVERDRLHDLGKLVLTFSIMATYLLYSQLLPIWYENLPHEIPFVVARTTTRPWLCVSVALLAVVYVGPLVLLLTARAKRSPRWLGAVSLLVLAGLWVERWWLVAPTLGQPPALSWADTAACAAFAGALGWGMSRLRRSRAPSEAGGRS